MKRRICIVLIVLFALLLLPHAASANAPAPDPFEIRVDYQNVPEGSTVTVLATDAAGAEHVLFEIVAGTPRGRMTFQDIDEAAFFVQMTAPDGAVTRSAPIAFEPRQSYRFDAQTGVLEQGRYLSDSCDGAWFALFGVLGVVWLVLALGVTIVIELLTGLCFRMRPVRHVIIINLITNPVMNILLLLLTLSVNGGGVYWIALAILELIVCGFEFWFYTRKYRDRKKWVLLVFTLTANALSAAAGLLPVWLLLR